MSEPEMNDGAEPRSSSERTGTQATTKSSSTKPRGSSANVNAPRAAEPVSAGSTRTPPPRTRRGAPTARPRSDDVADAAVAAAAMEPVTPTPTPRPKAGSKPKAAPGSTEVFDWEGTGSPKSGSTTRAPEISAASVTAAIATDPLDDDTFVPEPRARQAKPKKARRQERRFRQTVQRIDLWSVTKMALCFYVSAMAVVVVAMIALWAVADSAGIIDNVEKFFGDLFSADDFHFVSAAVLRGGVLVAIVLVALLVAFTIIAASFYNIFAELFGGVEIVIREEEHPPKR